MQQFFSQDFIPQSICLFCGASSGTDPIYAKFAYSFGKLLADRNIQLVYGGAKVGLMGIVADSALQYGGKVIGVMPKHLSGIEVAHAHLTELRIVPNMHQRKEMMFNLSDSIVVLPGGFGTLDELFEVLTWKQLGLHQKRIFLFNIAKFWQPLIKTIDHFIHQGFVNSINRQLFTIIENPEEMI